MNMVELISGIIVGGVAGVALKDKLMGADTQNETKQKELDSLYAENEKYSRRNKDLERQVEDLLSELNKVRKKANEADDDQDDLEDDLAKAKAEVKKLRAQNDELLRKIQEYKLACDSYENEINNFRNQLRTQNINDIENQVYSYSLGTMYMDIIAECEKLGDYVVNVVEAHMGVKQKEA